jgi:hypothetical protein
LSGGYLVPGSDEVKNSGLSSPVGPYNSRDFPLFDFEAEIVDGAEITERLSDMPQFKKAHEDLLS